MNASLGQFFFFFFTCVIVSKAAAIIPQMKQPAYITSSRTNSHRIAMVIISAPTGTQETPVRWRALEACGFEGNRVRVEAGSVCE